MFAVRAYKTVNGKKYYSDYTPVSATTKADFRTYTIQYGDTLSAIARKYNTTVDAIMKLNQITNANLLKVGQVLKIPA